MPSRRLPLALLSGVLVMLGASSPLRAAPQDPAAPPTSLDRVKDRLDTPIVRSLTPSVPVQLRPVFKSSVEKHPYVVTLDQALHKQFDLNALQRQSADWSSRCCGIDLAGVYKALKQANDDRRVSKTREQIARELAELQAARAAAGSGK